MRVISVCEVCGSSNITFIGIDTCVCNICNKTRKPKDKIVQSPYERTKSKVYATGNRWAIENFNATHN